MPLLKLCHAGAFKGYLIWYHNQHPRAKRLNTFESVWKGIRQLYYDRFINRSDGLKTRSTRSYDHQRAKQEDPEIIGAWFKLVANMKTKYGIQDEDTYNFDESGFMMGVIGSQHVVTASERRGRPKLVQPGNREWVTVIQGICAAGWAIPPFIIYAGKNHISTWYVDASIPRDWVIAVSDNGWTNNELGII